MEVFGVVPAPAQTFGDRRRRVIRRHIAALVIGLVAASAVVVPAGAATDPASSDAGVLLVWATGREGPGLYSVDLATAEPVHLPVDVAEMGGLAWSPDGTRIALTRSVAAEPAGRSLWIMNADGTEQRLIPAAGEFESLEQLAWSPDGRHVALMANRSHLDVPPELNGEYLVIVDTSGEKLMEVKLFGPTYTTTSLEWSPDGRKLLMGLFWYPSDGDNSIGVFDLASQQIEVIASGLHPSWSPDGRRVVFVHSESEEPFVPVATAVVSTDGTDLSEYPFLTGTWADTTRVGWFPQWSPDGTRIAYGILEHWDQHFELMDPEGGDRRAYYVGLSGITRLWWQPVMPESGFLDVPDDHSFSEDVAWMNEMGITNGCRHPYGRLFCPDQPISRGEAAAFLARALGLGEGGGDPFVDDGSSIFESDIERVAAVGITRGCNPPVNDRFCPDRNVTRGQAAAFLVRALRLADGGGADRFVDDDTSIFETDIDKLAAAGISLGCNPPANDKFCPNDHVTRQQMAAFLHRALG